jgi:pimeloyl-ACP methyl ester carboxylesterase
MGRICDFVLGRDRFDSLEEAVAYSVAFNPRRDPRLLRYSLRHALRPLPDGGWAWKRDRRHLSHDGVSALVQEVRATVHDAAAIGCPTLVVRGADSDVFGPDDAAEFATLVPDGRWVSVEDAGHNIQGDNPAGFLRVLDPFLAAHEEITTSARRRAKQ